MVSKAAIFIFVVYCQLAYSQFESSCSFTQPPRYCPSLDFYRTIDGSCNNENNPTWGQSMRPHTRLLQPEYGDHESLRSKSVTGNDLPSPRKISTAVLSAADQSSLSNKITNMVWLFGQFMDHDITLTPQTEMRPCCEGSSSEDCMPISIPADDPFWGPRGRTCMNLVRSIGVNRNDCGVRHREQLNAITPLIDASNVYGSTTDQAKQLRSFQDGLLKTSSGDTLPLEDATSECNIPNTEPINKCFAAGDIRATEWHGLASIHTMFLRLHNKIAGQLKPKLQTLQLSATVEDEVLYQETRRIIGAIIQKITYSDFLPIVIGTQNTLLYRLYPGFHYYDTSVKPAVTNAFATAAYRFGHSLITDHMTPTDSSFRRGTPVLLRDSFFQPSTYHAAGQDNTIRGICLEAANKADDKFSQEIKNHLFEKSERNGGGDLIAFNIQRGRDHGLPSYNEYRKRCRLTPATSFDSMPSHRYEIAQKLASVYEHPDDIDLFSGGITEEPVSGALVGPTFACIIADQFRRLKVGDRFYYENGSGPQAFDPYQLREIKKMTLAKVICETTNSQSIPENVFELNSRTVSCGNLPGINLEDWITATQIANAQRLQHLSREELDELITTAPAVSRPHDLFVFGRFKVHD